MLQAGRRGFLSPRVRVPHKSRRCCCIRQERMWWGLHARLLPAADAALLYGPRLQAPKQADAGIEQRSVLAHKG
jgi:hypothetical protein